MTLPTYNENLKKKPDFKKAEQRFKARKITKLQQKENIKQGFSIGEREFSSLNCLKSIPKFDEIGKVVCCTAVVITLLCQVAFFRIKEKYEGNIDQTPTFKFWKERFYRTDAVIISLSSLSVAESLSYINATNPSDVFAEIVSTSNSYNKSYPFLDGKVNYKNQKKWRLGVISRCLGIMNSLVANNFSMFNLDSEKLENFTITDVLNLIPIEDKPSVDEIVKSIRSAVLFPKEQEISLNETPLSKDIKYTPIEREIFGEDGSIYKREVVKEAPSVKREYTLEEVSSALSNLEFQQFLHAKKVKNRTKIKLLLQKVEIFLQGSKEGVDSSDAEERTKISQSQLLSSFGQVSLPEGETPVVNPVDNAPSLAQASPSEGANPPVDSVENAPSLKQASSPDQRDQGIGEGKSDKKWQSRTKQSKGNN